MTYADLGDLVEDEVTGFKGIVMAKHIYLQGCNRLTVQPSIGEDGKLPATETFDEPQLIILQPKKIKRKTVPIDPGGPDKYTDKGR